MIRRSVPVLLTAAAVPLAAAAFAGAGGQEARPSPLLSYSIVGSSSCAAKPCFGDVMGRIPVQRLLLELAKGPLERPEAERLLANDARSLEDLLALRLVRPEGDRLLLGFALFTASDVRRIREISESHAESLADALLARRGELEEAVKAYDMPGADPGAVLYFLLGCASLDWDGLALTAEMGYRRTTGERPDGAYVPAAQEVCEESLERIYWGSHNAAYEGVGFTSFGDHHALPRLLLPDLLWRAPEPPSSYPEALKAALRGLFAGTLDLAAGRMGRMMLTLRDGPAGLPDLARAAGVPGPEAESLLRVLSAVEYVGERDGRYRALVPVLAKRDKAMADRVIEIGRRVMGDWLKASYGRIEAGLAGLSFMRSGVPFPEGFTMIWHYVFGIANRKLVEAGLFADPYGAARAFKGALPAVHELEL